MLLQLEDLKKELIDYEAACKTSVPHPKKALLLAINVPLKILTGHPQDHQPHSSTFLNLNSALKAEATIETYGLQKANNHMAYVVPPPTPGGSCTTISYSDVHITNKMSIHLTYFSPTSVSFPN